MKKLVYTSALSIIVAAGAVAQSNITQYNFDRVGNFMLANPAAYQPYRAVVGVPGISALATTVHNPSFDLNVALGPDLDGQESVDYILDNIQQGDRLLIGQSIDLMYVGFRTGNGFWSLGVQSKTYVNFEYPIDFIELAVYGSASDQVGGTLNMKDNFTEVNSYINYHLGYQHELMDGRLRVGGRFKWLQGVGHASLAKSDLDATLNSDEWTFNTDIEANIGAAIDYQNTGAGLDPMGVLFGDNRGWAFDLGVSYEILPRLEISAAATDIGSITWKSNTTTYRSKGEFTWDGADYNYGSEGGGINGDSLLNDIIEALEFQETTGETFTTSLPSNYTIGVRYDITRKHGFAGTYQMNQWRGRTYQNFGVSYIGNWSKWFSFYASYALIEGDNTNIGVGFSANLGPIQLYIMTDDIYLATGENLNHANFRFGMNIALYRKDLRGYDLEIEEVEVASPPVQENSDNSESQENND
ncbi:DUF5723 family protein [Phaeocystidibacter luteus]|uniref:DUF5723 domain-containing protein n=1 Tax=Phaeocystidibacter luteus TaxID=911197 RepID=A0A6N6RLF3_9FLAO|nr:DUF5723 family protein [Phaeocystidibacter luteus]KAB2814405.1 hypothetical protein F8C67_01335 [Phaeocystidibacter luteus]